MSQSRPCIPPPPDPSCFRQPAPAPHVALTPEQLEAHEDASDEFCRLTIAVRDPAFYAARRDIATELRRRERVQNDNGRTPIPPRRARVVA